MSDHDELVRSDEPLEEPSLDMLSQAFAEAMGRSPAGPSQGEEQQPASAHDVEESRELDNVDADDACPISPKSVLEAILFVGHPENEPITAAAVAKLLRGVEPNEMRELVDDLNDDYQSGGVPFRIEAVGGGYHLGLESRMDNVRERFLGRIREARLSNQAIDVLSVVAYKQPVTRKQVDALLNASTSRVLNQLVRRQLLALEDVPGKKTREKQYVTTDRFLALFGIDDLQDLPRSDEPQ